MTLDLGENNSETAASRSGWWLCKQPATTGHHDHEQWVEKMRRAAKKR